MSGFKINGYVQRLIVLMHNLSSEQECSVRTEYGDGFQLANMSDKHLFYFPICSIYMQNISGKAGLDLGEGKVNIDERNINNLKYADKFTLLLFIITGRR